MNAVAFITDFISKDNTSSLDVFYASVVITACFSNILLHSLVWHNVRAATTAVYYWDCGVTPNLRNTYRFPCSHACLHLRTSLRDPHSADRARNSVFCWSGDCTSPCLKRDIPKTQHRDIGASFLLPAAIGCWRQHGDGTHPTQAGNGVKRHTWPQLLKKTWLSGSGGNESTVWLHDRNGLFQP